MILITAIYAIIWIVAVVLLYGMVNRGQVMQSDLTALEQLINSTTNSSEAVNAE